MTWYSQVGHSLIIHADRDAAVNHVVRRCRQSEGLALELDAHIMPTTTIIIRDGVVVKTATRETMTVEQAKAAYDAARDAYEKSRRDQWTAEDRRYYESQLRKARTRYERLSGL